MIPTKDILNDLVFLEVRLLEGGELSAAAAVLEARERLRILYDMLDSVSEGEADDWVRDRLDCEGKPS